MNSRIGAVRSLTVRCCSWGHRARIEAKDYLGGPVPLLVNPLPILTRRIAIANLVLLFLTGGTIALGNFGKSLH